MSMFDLFSPRKRKYQAALTVLLAEYTFERLSDKQKDQIQASVRRVVERSGAEPLAAFAMPHRYRYGLIAAALKEQGIPPAVPGEQWTLAGNPFMIREDDEEFDVAMSEAYAYLESKGVKLE
jgi:hypothetical protein